jgi:rubredoxin
MIVDGSTRRILDGLDYTFCPHCRKRGRMTAMTLMPEMAFRGNAVWICPKCGVTLDKVIDRQIPKPLRPKKKGRVFQVILPNVK